MNVIRLTEGPGVLLELRTVLPVPAAAYPVLGSLAEAAQLLLADDMEGRT